MPSSLVHCSLYKVTGNRPRPVHSDTPPFSLTLEADAASALAFQLFVLGFQPLELCFEFFIRHP